MSENPQDNGITHSEQIANLQQAVVSRVSKWAQQNKKSL